MIWSQQRSIKLEGPLEFDVKFVGSLVKGTGYSVPLYVERNVLSTIFIQYLKENAVLQEKELLYYQKENSNDNNNLSYIF